MNVWQIESLAAAALPCFKAWYGDTYANDDDSISEALLLSCLAQYAHDVYQDDSDAGRKERDKTLDNIAFLLEAAAESGGELKNAVTVGFFETATYMGEHGPDFQLRLGDATLNELHALLNSDVDPYDPFRYNPQARD